MGDKIYAVIYDNGEPYEGGFSYTVAVYKTREAAEKYLDSKYERCDEKGYDRRTHWVNRHEVKKCSRGHTYDECEECPVWLDWEDRLEETRVNGKPDEFELIADEEPCAERKDIENSYFDKAYDFAWLYIEELELKE